MLLEVTDNLPFMKKLKSETIDLIYCDVLYGTGKKFKDYDDLKPDEYIIDHHYYPRLKEMHRLLKNTGTIYIQSSIQIDHWLRGMLDEIFEYKNFRNQIIIPFNIGGRGKREFAKKHDVIAVYSKSKVYTFNDEDIRVPYRSVISKNSKRPNITKEKLEKGTIPTNVWGDIPNGLKVKKKTDYFSEKHEKLLERIIKASSNKGDMVADFYLGSGTTAYIANKLNREFIGCDINPKSIEETKKRILKK